MRGHGQVTVIGDGGWGTAVALVLVENGHRVVMWGHDAAQLEEMRVHRENRSFLPGVRLPEALSFEPDLDAAIDASSLAFVAVPTKFLRASLQRASRAPSPETGFVSLTKGIEVGTLARPTQIVGECLGAERVAVLSGPSHAEEVARRKPTTVVVASEDPSLPLEAQRALFTQRFRPYTAADMLGVELAGALKNVIALAAGIATGLELGDNAMAALLTRGLAEMTRLGVSLGAEASTFSGLSGIGDLVVTCTSQHGRNRSVGIELGRGRSLEEIVEGMSQVAEGVTTATAARALGERAGIELPIVEQVCRVLYEGLDPMQGVTELMTRAPKPERPLGE
jgi:glycerol-3-phosphate dehydrogenase (NAD(P)+)